MKYIMVDTVKPGNTVMALGLPFLQFNLPQYQDILIKMLLDKGAVD